MVKLSDPIHTLFQEIHSIGIDRPRVYCDMLRDLLYQKILNGNDEIACIFDYKNDWYDYVCDHYPPSKVHNFHECMNMLQIEDEVESSSLLSEHDLLKAVWAAGFIYAKLFALDS
jgi:hypothetical protein